MVSRHVQQSTASSISGQSGGIGTSLAVPCITTALAKDGGFASKVIGSIATGQTSGSIYRRQRRRSAQWLFFQAPAMRMPCLFLPLAKISPTAMATAENDAVIDSPIPAHRWRRGR